MGKSINRAYLMHKDHILDEFQHGKDIWKYNI